MPGQKITTEEEALSELINIYNGDEKKAKEIFDAISTSANKSFSTSSDSQSFDDYLLDKFNEVIFALSYKRSQPEATNEQPRLVCRDYFAYYPRNVSGNLSKSIHSGWYVDFEEPKQLTKKTETRGFIGVMWKN
ncbi:hypothetical protein L3V79_08525 [Thiotrichales bacterium 19S9-12]|nr:hypothetical protein [Thiotrichales bacterium 19S9-11]MCF6812399.1 hypothetical protein [Thiotrichales bacterium 19S9-12]